MEIVAKKSTRFLMILALVAFLLVAFLGMSKTVMGMEKRSDGTMSGCLFTGKVEICTMSLVNHISQWQGMFTTISPKINELTLLAYLLVALATIIAVSRRSRTIVSEVSASSSIYAKRNFHIPIFDPLMEAFSQGILNPKIYNSAVI